MRNEYDCVVFPRALPSHCWSMWHRYSQLKVDLVFVIFFFFWIRLWWIDKTTLSVLFFSHFVFLLLQLQLQRTTFTYLRAFVWIELNDEVALLYCFECTSFVSHFHIHNQNIWCVGVCSLPMFKCVSMSIEA